MSNLKNIDYQKNSQESNNYNQENTNKQINKTYNIIFSKKALKDLQKLLKDKKLTDKVQTILTEIKSNPYSQIHKFERLKYNYTGYCSMRIDQKNRIIYKVEDDRILILVISLLGHYEN